MIYIYRSNYRCRINFFDNKTWVHPNEVVIKTKEVIPGKIYKYAVPANCQEGNSFAFGGSFLYTSNGIYPEFNEHPIPLHDRMLWKE